MGRSSALAGGLFFALTLVYGGEAAAEPRAGGPAAAGAKGKPPTTGKKGTKRKKGAAEEEPSPPGAKKKQEGDEAMQEKRFADALTAYEAAYAEHADPALLYNRARAEELSGHFPEALALLERFESEASAELLARVPTLSELTARMRASVALLTIKVNVDGAHVRLRGNDLGTSPLRPSIRVPMGPALVEISRDGYLPFSRALVLPGGSTSVVEATLEAPAPPPVLGPRAASAAPTERRPATQEPSSTSEAKAPPLTSRWWLWTGIGVAVVSGAVVTAALLTERSPGKGSIAPGQITANLAF